MGAKMIISQPEADQGFGLLKDIIDMVKNPKAIDEAYERRRKAAQLSDDEVEKSEEARALIAKADSLRADLQTKQNAIEDARAEHGRKILQHVEDMKAKSAAMTEWETRLNTITAQQVETSRKQIDKENSFDARVSEIENAQKERELDLQRREEVVAQTDKAQKLESDRLIAEDKRLKQKAARIAAEASKD